MSISLDLNEDLLYPSGDGKPMAENTEQYRWIVMIKENLELLFADQPDVFIAADLFWYPVKVNAPPVPHQAPDVMVVLGRPKGKRRSYKQWQEGNLPAQIVFEILSDSNKTREGRQSMEAKLRFYEQYGVEEYYIYDPDEFILQGWQRQGQALVPIAGMADWVSPRLGIRFEWQAGMELEVYQPDGRRFLGFLELEQQLQQAQQRAEQAERSLQDAVPRLLALGLNVEQIATSLGLPIATIQAIADSINR